MGFINLYMDPYSSTIIREFRPVACFKIFFRKWDDDPKSDDHRIYVIHIYNYIHTSIYT